ncbi:DUF4333 domain-containing protein [Bogoriella caseilytica]|nr:DUF4333 domain-containing protein [Bogoriella caseilytica]
MHQTISKIMKAAVVPVAAGLLLAGCGGAVVEQGEVEAQVADQLEQMVGQRPNVDCPGDLEAEVGATMDCVLSEDGHPDEYLVSLTVTSVEDGVASWDFQVADEPM